MNPNIQLCLVLHNHQPVGNFDGVFQAAFEDSYQPFLDVFESFEELKISLHTSGPLVKWLEQNQPKYLDRIARLVQAGRIEIVGGAFYEPILAMIPTRDRIGQIRQFTTWLENRLGGPVHGMWMPERVWESNMASDLAQANIHYTVLDDFHFRRAGLTDDQLDGYYIVEDQGRTICVFPGSEQLRYLIPFAEPQETIDYCRGLAERNPGSVVTFGDDGEKFGTWPHTKEHVYRDGWLRRFFEALTENKSWLRTSTLSQAVESTRPRGKTYLPDASYREMTEWALPVARQHEFENLSHEMENDHRWTQIHSFIAGGYWRNFKTKYTETNEMYSRMMIVSQLLEQAEQVGVDPAAVDVARDHLYQGQCNCSYWHGAFGGVYLPHLRNAVYYHLIQAENLLIQASPKPNQWTEAKIADYNFDGRQEIQLCNDKMACWIAAHQGGQIYELDLREFGLNLGAAIQRRPEVYHDKVLAGQSDGDQDTASIHDRVVFKQDGLEQQLHYDQNPRNILIDHFWDEDVSLDDIAQNKAQERGDFFDGIFATTIRRNPDRIQVKLTREGNAWGVPLTITKGVTLSAGSNQLEIAYLIEGLPVDRQFRFGVEFNFAGMPDGQDDRFFSDPTGNHLGQLGSKLDLQDTGSIRLTDGWLKLDVDLSWDQNGSLWTYPVQSVSQSEAGFELVHQAVCVQPHWIIQGDRNGRWSTQMRLTMSSNVSAEQPKANQLTASN